jgi:hypothetical protein
MFCLLDMATCQHIAGAAPQVRKAVQQIYLDCQATVGGSSCDLQSIANASLHSDSRSAQQLTMSTDTLANSIPLLSGSTTNVQKDGPWKDHDELLLHSTAIAGSPPSQCCSGRAEPCMLARTSTGTPQGGLAAWQVALLLLSVAAGCLVAATDGDIIGIVQERMRRGSRKGWIRVAVELDGRSRHRTRPNGPWWTWA